MVAELPPLRQLLLSVGICCLVLCQLPGFPMSVLLPVCPRTLAHARAESQRALQMLQYCSVSGEKEISKHPFSIQLCDLLYILPLSRLLCSCAYYVLFFFFLLTKADIRLSKNTICCLNWCLNCCSVCTAASHSLFCIQAFTLIF